MVTCVLPQSLAPEATGLARAAEGHFFKSLEQENWKHRHVSAAAIATRTKAVCALPIQPAKTLLQQPGPTACPPRV